jgi:hypothetical protein
MSADVQEFPFEVFEEPIQQALEVYTGRTNERIGFDDPVAASQLRETPEGTTSARAMTDVTFEGIPVGSLVVIAFAPGDGTGKESALKLKNLSVHPDYPRDVRVVPRNKTCHTEVHLPIESRLMSAPNSASQLFTGSLDLLGLNRAKKRPQVAKIGTLGQERIDLWRGVTLSDEAVEPKATYTVGYDPSNRRFGNQHAVFNSVGGVMQVCGFFAVSPEVATQHPRIIDVVGMWRRSQYFGANW